MQRRARILAPVLAGVLGVTGGAVTASLTRHDAPPQATTPTYDDPLGLDVPLRNLPSCDGEAILVVGRGKNRAALDTGVANNSGVHYLQTADSCRTQYTAPNARTTPKFVAYLGPFADLEQPCRLRMSGEHAVDYVTRLQQGNTELVKCPCVLEYADAPTLQVEPRPSAADNVWARSLQGMLHDDDPKAFPRNDISGTYDEITRRYILTKFQRPAGYLGRNGLMNGTTWRIVRGKICPRYTY